MSETPRLADLPLLRTLAAVSLAIAARQLAGGIGEEDLPDRVLRPGGAIAGPAHVPGLTVALEGPDTSARATVTVARPRRRPAA